MRILLIEDDSAKAAEIREVIEGACADKASVEVDLQTTINAGIFAIGSNSYDLIVADLVLPQISGATDTQDATGQWCELIESSTQGRATAWVVMTSYSELASGARESFARHGVAVIEYDETDGWKRVLRNRVVERFVNPPSDFVVICALEKEREGVRRCDAVTVGESFTVSALDCLEVAIGPLQGVVVRLPRVGLVASAIATMRAAEVFRPRALAMCGICAGIAGESQIGDLLVPDLSWNYQAGKLKGGAFEPELVQVQVPPDTSAKLAQMATKATLQRLRQGLLFEELASREIHMQPMVSGSMVVADAAIAAGIGNQSRKVAGLDMEVASVFAAAHSWFNGGGIFLAAKTVVDLADGNKDDRYHEYGCLLSARFTVEALRVLLS